MAFGLLVWRIIPFDHQILTEGAFLEGHMKVLFGGQAHEFANRTTVFQSLMNQ